MQALQKEFSRQKRIFAAGIFACLQKKNSGGLGENYEIIISPAKRMEECGDLFEPGAPAVFLERTKLLLAVLKGKSEGELKELFGANERITHENFLRYAEWIWTGRRPLRFYPMWGSSISIWRPSCSPMKNGNTRKSMYEF